MKGWNDRCRIHLSSQECYSWELRSRDYRRRQPVLCNVHTAIWIWVRVTSPDVLWSSHMCQFIHGRTDEGSGQGTQELRPTWEGSQKIWGEKNRETDQRPDVESHIWRSNIFLRYNVSQSLVPKNHFREGRLSSSLAKARWRQKWNWLYPDSRHTEQDS